MTSNPFFLRYAAIQEQQLWVYTPVQEHDIRSWMASWVQQNSSGKWTIMYDHWSIGEGLKETQSWLLFPSKEEALHKLHIAMGDKNPKFNWRLVTEVPM